MLLDATMTIGERFKHIRTEKGFSQSELAEGICSKSVVSHLENDRAYPSASMLGKLADKLGVPLREIMGMQEKQFEAAFQIEIVRVYVEKADYNHALELIDELDRRIDLLDHQRIELLILRADSKLKSAKYVEVVDLLLPFLEDQQKHLSIDEEMLCDAYNKLGNAYYRLNDFDRAYSAFEHGYRLTLKLPEFGLISARVTKNLGLTCNQLGFLNDARRYLEKAYIYYEGASDARGIANTLFDLATATGDLEHMKTARLMYESLNMVIEANLAKLHYAFFVEAKNDFPVAMNNFNSSVTTFEQIGQKGLAIYSRSRAAIASLEAGEMAQAKQYLEDAQAELERIGEEDLDPTQYVDFYKARAKYYLLAENYDLSIADSQKSSEMYDRMGLYSESADALQISAEVFTRQGMHESASNVYRKVVELLRKNSQGGLM